VAVRALPILLVVGLLGGTAAAFAVTENLKLERSPVFDTRVSKLFGPGCECERQRASIDFRLRRADRLTLTIVDSSGKVVRTLADGAYRRPGPLHFAWDGTDDNGLVVEDAVYRPRIHLAAEHRTILLPNRIHADTTTPKLTLVSLSPRVISPDRDNRHDHFSARYRVSEAARPLLFLNGRLVARLYRFKPEGVFNWGRGLKPGTYRFQFAAEDLAGNVGALTAPVVVRIRYIDLTRKVLRVRAGGRIVVSVSTDAKRYRWRLGGGTGLRPGSRPLVLRAPQQPGRYVLAVSAAGHSDRALVIVGAP
jgi:hypothetical protein